MKLRSYNNRDGRITNERFWADCDLVERVPGKVAGRPVIKGTRIEPDTIIQDFELGSPVEEIHENFPSLPVETIRKLIALAYSHQPVF